MKFQYLNLGKIKLVCMYFINITVYIIVNQPIMKIPRSTWIVKRMKGQIFGVG